MQKCKALTSFIAEFKAIETVGRGHYFKIFGSTYLPKTLRRVKLTQTA